MCRAFFERVYRALLKECIGLFEKNVYGSFERVYMALLRECIRHFLRECSFLL